MAVDLLHIHTQILPSMNIKYSWFWMMIKFKKNAYLLGCILFIILSNLPIDHNSSSNYYNKYWFLTSSDKNIILPSLIIK